MTRRGWFLFAAMSIIWGLPYLFIRVAVKHVEPGTLVFLRTGIGALVLLPIAIWRRQLLVVLPRWRWLLTFAAVEVIGPWLLLNDAERHLTSSLAGLSVAAVPLVGACIARFSSHGDQVSRRQLGGLLVGLTGVACLVGLDLGHLDGAALVEMAGVVIGYAFGPVILARKLSGLPGLGVIAAAMTMTAVLCAPFALLQPPDLGRADVAASVAVLGLLCTAVAFILFFELIAAIGPTRSTVITYLNPAVALALGVAVLGEQVTAGMVAGFPLILLGSILATRSGRQSASAPAGDALVTGVPARS